jgi:two-component system cell cycle response regulator DivK
MLERKGYRVLLADSGDSGIRLARKEHPSMILLDLGMAGKDGFATAREIRADAEIKETPLVAVTAMAMRGDEMRARQAGFDSYLSKPVDRAVLEETVERLLKQGRRQAP